jgi:sterol 3beta-glucosyltransferase
MEHAHEMTRTILDAVRICGVRAIVSEGWSKLGSGVSDYKDILFIGECPHGNYALADICLSLTES